MGLESFTSDVEHQKAGLKAELEVEDKFGCVDATTTRAQTQVVAGTNYKLEIQAECDGAKTNFEVVVFSQPWTQTLQVTSIQRMH